MPQCVENSAAQGTSERMEHMVTEGGVVIYNPTAGRGKSANQVELAKDMLGSAFEWVPTQRAGHAVELAKEYAAKVPVVVACGGDGTVSDVAKGLYGTEAILGVLPAGTGNDFARNLNLPTEMREAVATVLAGNVRRIDVGLINNTPFINNCGTGFDAQVMVTMNESIRFTRGPLAFNLAILKNFFTFKPFTLSYTVDEGKEVKERAMMISVLNGKVYAAGMQAAPHADMDDGWLDLIIIKALPRLQLAPLISKVRSGTHLGHPAIISLQVRSVKIEAVPTQPLNIDGDIRGATPATIGVSARALKVLVR